MKVESMLGTVTSNEDPAKAGAIRVTMPEIGGEEFPEWIEPIFASGWFWPPEPGDTVVLKTPEGEDLSEFTEAVIYEGRLISEGEGIPEEFKINYPSRRGFKTKEGHLLIIDDKDKDIILKTAYGHEINLLESGSVEVSNANGSKVVIEQTGKIHVDAPETDLSDTSTDYVLKGTQFKTDFLVFLNAWKTALMNSSPPATDPNWIAYKSAMQALVATLVTAVTGWVSNKVKTG